MQEDRRSWHKQSLPNTLARPTRVAPASRLPRGHFVACVKAVENDDTFRAYHLDNGKQLTPDYTAIRAAIPHYHRKAFDRAGGWRFPLTLNSALSGITDAKNAASLTLNDSKGRLLGTLYATPYLYDRG